MVKIWHIELWGGKDWFRYYPHSHYSHSWARMDDQNPRTYWENVPANVVPVEAKDAMREMRKKTPELFEKLLDS